MKTDKIERLASAVMDDKGKYNLNLDKVTKSNEQFYIVQIGNIEKQFGNLKSASRDFKTIFSIFDTKLKPKVEKFLLLNAVMESDIDDHGLNNEYDNLYNELWKSLCEDVCTFDPEEEKLTSYIKYYFV